MLKPADLENLLNSPGRSNLDRGLLCLAFEPMSPRNKKEIADIARKHGWSSVNPKSLSTYLERARERSLAILSGIDGWKLTDDGVEHVKGLAQGRAAFKAPAVAISLRAHLSKITDTDTRAFVEDAVRCFEYGLYRAAVVMSWVGAVHLLYTYVITNKLSEFNTAATKRLNHPKFPWKTAKSVDDLTLMKESDFLEVLQDVSVIGKPVKTALKICLDRRNNCGHPNSYKLAENVVAAHIEELMLNVYEKF